MLPSLFVSHGSPMLALAAADSQPAAQFLQQYAAQHFSGRAKPSAIVVISAHWTSSQLLVSQTSAPATVHDFNGFPEQLYRLRYNAPGSPQLAQRIAKLCAAQLVERGFDHGVWVPLRWLFADADVPVVSLSLPWRWSNSQLLALGQQLRALRDEHILILGSGSLTHNLQRLQPAYSATPDWVLTFRDWVTTQLQSDSLTALNHWQQAPQALANHPSPEHFLPLLIAAGAGDLPAQHLHSSISHGVLAMDAFAF